MLGAKTSVPCARMRGRNELPAHRSPSASNDQEKHMTRFESFFKPLMWFVALLLAAFVAGCGDRSPSQGSSAAAAAATMPRFGTEQSFAVLGGSTVTNTGSSVITGNLGVSPGSAITGFPPGILTGVIHAADAQALQAQNDTTETYIDLASQGCTSDLTGQDLGGKTLVPGVYCFSSSAQLTGALTLDAGGDPSAVWVFKTGSTLTTASNSSVLLLNGGQPCNVFWQIGSSATLGTGSSFRGTIIALTSITVTTGTTVDGRVLARNGAVTLDTDTITKPNCAATATTTAATATTSATTTTVAAPAPTPTPVPKPKPKPKPPTKRVAPTTTTTAVVKKPAPPPKPKPPVQHVGLTG
jgi:type VI secretion system secreted protein VgrG